MDKYMEALNALKKQANAVINNGAFTPDKDLLAEAQQEMSTLQVYVDDIYMFLSNDKDGITVETADEKWLETTLHNNN